MTGKGTILVTGASGFIAKHIVRQLLQAGYAVRGSVRKPSRAADVTKAVAAGLADAERIGARLSFATLDLERDEGWPAALTGVDALVHTASPFPLEQPRDEQDAIRPAVEGTLRALRAAKAANVPRVILTSSTVAITYKTMEPGRTVLDERDWTDLSDPRATPYAKSKTLAERAAWDFVAKEAPDLKLTVINPSFVLGAPLDADLGTSIQVVRRILRSQDPMLPNFGFPSVDVGDIATMHVRALERPETAGRRYIGGDEFLWYPQMAKILKEAFPQRRIVTRRAPNAAVRLLGIFDRAVRSIVPNLDRPDHVTADRARHEFGMTFMPARDSLIAAGRYLIDNRLV